MMKKYIHLVGISNKRLNNIFKYNDLCVLLVRRLTFYFNINCIVPIQIFEHFVTYTCLINILNLIIT